MVNYSSTLNANTCTVQGNGSGIRASGSSVLRLQENTITQNGNDGVVALLVSLAYFVGGNTVTDNGNAGVRVKDLSMGVFLGEDVTGNQGGTDVLCEPQAPQTRGTATVLMEVLRIVLRLGRQVNAKSTFVLGSHKWRV